MDLNFAAIGAMLAIGLAGLWVTIGEWILARTSVDILWKNPTMYTPMLVYTVLWLALVESGAIYWLVVAFQILSKEGLDALTYIGSWLAIGITWFWIGLMEWIYVAKCLEAMNRNPENRTKVLQFMILFIALIESAGIYGLIVALKILL